ncbi:MAG: hypothetical protein J6Q97_00995, partial [Bacteroidaceae bacterium]|nr:hypothetical protein [Bacteroidaceae bacterium]
MNKTNVFGAVQNSASSSSRISNLTKRLAVLTLLLLTFVLGTRAASYVFYYEATNGTKYYMANVNNALTAVTTYNAST